jgi:hypothetical protein
MAVCGGLAARLSESSGGRAPTLTAKPTGRTPPVVEMLAEYGVPAVPPGSVVVVTASGFAACIVNVCVAVCGGTEESVTVTPNENEPTAVAVPLKAPLDPSVMPVGSAPLVTTKLYGGVPPEATIDDVYAALVRAVGKVCGARTSVVAGAETVRLSVPVVALFAGLALSTTVTANVNVPKAVGVPVRIPALLNVRPGGSAPLATLHVRLPTPPNSRKSCV